MSACGKSSITTAEEGVLRASLTLPLSFQPESRAIWFLEETCEDYSIESGYSSVNSSQKRKLGYVQKMWQPQNSQGKTQGVQITAWKTGRGLFKCKIVFTTISSFGG